MKNPLLSLPLVGASQPLAIYCYMFLFSSSEHTSSPRAEAGVECFWVQRCKDTLKLGFRPFNSQLATAAQADDKAVEYLPKKSRSIFPNRARPSRQAYHGILRRAHVGCWDAVRYLYHDTSQEVPTLKLRNVRRIRCLEMIAHFCEGTKGAQARVHTCSNARFQETILPIWNILFQQMAQYVQRRFSCVPVSR